MRKLLRADMARLFRDKLFYFAIAVLAGFEIMAISEGHRLINRYHYPITMLEYLFLYFQMLGLVFSVFSSLHLGRLYGDGTIRNKLVVGHNRCAVYFAVFLTMSAAIVIMHVISFLAGYLLGGTLLGGFPESVSLWLWPFLCGILTGISYAAIFTLIGMLCSQKAVTAVISVLAAFFLLLGATYLNSRLQQPEMIPEYEYVIGEYSTEEEAGEPVRHEKMSRNPNYLEKGFKRDCFQFLFDALPGGQSYLIASLEVDKPGLYAGYSAMVIVLAAGAGCIAFRRKDIQ